MRTCTRIVDAFLGYEILLIDIHWQDYLRLRPEGLGFEVRSLSHRNVDLIRDRGTSEWWETVCLLTCPCLNSHPHKSSVGTVFAVNVTSSSYDALVNTTVAMKTVRVTNHVQHPQGLHTPAAW